MTTINELRDLVRAQTQTTSGDLGDPTIDWWLQQAYERTINAEVRWPFFEQQWSVRQEIDETWVMIPGDVNLPGIISFLDQTTRIRLEQVPQWQAEDYYLNAVAPTTGPYQYSIWGDRINLWPAIVFTEAKDYVLRGYRKPVTWLTTAQEPDCDARLHLPLVHYAVALAYAQQEDDVLELKYMDRWQRDAEMAHNQIMDPPHHRPLIGGGSIDNAPVWQPGWVLVPPP